MEQNCQDWENCVGLLKLMNQYDKALVETRAEQKLIVEKLDDLTSEVRDMKQSLGSDLDARIDARIEAKFNEKTAKMSRWVVTAILGSGGLSALISLLLSK